MLGRLEAIIEACEIIQQENVSDAAKELAKITAYDHIRDIVFPLGVKGAG